MIDRTVIICFVVLIALVGIEILGIDMHPEVSWEYIPGHMAMIGFISHMVVVLTCKWIGKHFLQKPEDFDE